MATENLQLQLRHAEPRTIVYYTPEPASPERLLPRFGQPDPEPEPEHPTLASIATGGLPISWSVRQQPGALQIDLDHLYVHLIILDLRFGPDVAENFDRFLERGLSLLHQLDAHEEVEARYSFHRIMALVSGPNEEAVDRLIAELGSLRVGRVLRHRPEESDTSFRARMIREANAILQGHERGKVALCASGGGTTGIFFELGVLKCLEDCFANRTANDFDLYFGISAGAVVSGILASGYSVSDFMRAIGGARSERLAPLDLRLLQLRHLRFSDMFQRTTHGLKLMATDLSQYLKGQSRPAFDRFLLGYADLVGAPFHSDAFERTLRETLSQPEATNDFRKLRRPLFIGATDHDTREHVLFGAPGADHIPISKAIQASLSFNPVFAPVEIEGRRYVDGAITRTSEFVEAIGRGADLIFVVDPFVPYVAKSGGSARRRHGILYNIDQDLRTISYTRFQNTRHWVLRQHPEVSCYTFLPSNTLRGMMGSNPMDSRPFLEIWRGAYLSTFQRMCQIEHRLRGDASAHGIRVDVARAQEVASRLQHVGRRLRVQDFLLESEPLGAGSSKRSAGDTV